jgi:hypothetical protein
LGRGAPRPAAVCRCMATGRRAWLIHAHADTHARSTSDNMRLSCAAIPCCWSSAPGAGEEVVGGDSVGLVPQGPGQQPMGAAQLAALLR